MIRFPLPTLLIKREDIARLLTVHETILAVEQAFLLWGEGKIQMPPKVYLQFEKGDLRCMPVFSPDFGFACVKNVSVHPQNTSMPTIGATLTLFDPGTGFPLAILEGGLITQLRTAAAAAIATKYLARKNSKCLGIIGCGFQASAQIRAVCDVMPRLEKVVLFDRLPHRSQQLLQTCDSEIQIEARVAGSVEMVLQECDILTTLTPATEFFVENQFVGEGLHINAMGADAPGKQEIDPALFSRARLFVDSWEQAAHSGEVNRSVTAGILQKADVVADLGAVVCGRTVGRQSDKEITIFDSTGLAIQDLACAAFVYNSIISDKVTLASIDKISFVEAPVA